MSDSKLPSPPEATFEILISMLSTQAAAAMGIIKVPGQENLEKRLDYAKHFIDLLSIIEAKTKGNLESDEAQVLEQSLYQLRMLFVQSSK